jgi:ketosteroid isomerase-like protein
MKTALTLLLLSVAACAADASQDEKDILATLAVWKQAALKGDAATLDKLFHKDLVYSHNNAKIENKEQAIAGAISPETKSKGIEYHDLVTHVYGSTGVMTGRFVITTATGNVNNMHVLIVWLKGPQGWLIVARHSVKIPDAPSAVVKSADAK